jgi:quercetin dioxygenase-like cupin family protein
MEIYNSIAEINTRILDAEKYNKQEYFGKILSDDFIFRKGNGLFVDKATYLMQLPSISYEILKQLTLEIIPMNDESAYAIIKMLARGKRDDQSEFGGTFRNVRFFRRYGEDWLLYAWRNDEIKTDAPEEYVPEDKNPAGLGGKDKFSGTVLVQKLLEQGLPEGRKWQQVFFHPGARTRWHIHPEGQDLVILAGNALVVKKINGVDEINRLTAGQQINISPGILHWHGATQDSFMVHIAYNGYTISSETSYWFDEVNNDEYAKANCSS